MKKNFLSMFALTALFLAGCSSEEVTPSGETSSANGEGETHYMAVNLVSSDGTRATGDYEIGETSENQVEKVRFYFFTSDGSAADVKLEGGSYVNYYDWTPGGETPGKEGDNVAKKLAATIVINSTNGDKLPQMVAAVLNPVSDSEAEGYLDNKSKDLSKLQEIVANYADNALTQNGKFVMFNSVFKKDGAEYCAVPITAKNLQKESSEAEKYPVTIYVERSVAKVQVTTDPKVGFENGKLALKDKDDKPILVDGQQVYLQLNAWSLTAETSNGRMVKKINPAWQGSWWNLDMDFRSLWAINSPSAVNRYDSYEAISGKFATDDKSNAKYTNENAAKLTKKEGAIAKFPAEKNTKVIISGMLCDEKGAPFTIVRHLGAHFADNSSLNEAENFPELKKNILAQLSANGYHFYYETKENDKTDRKQIEPDDLKIVTPEVQNKENSGNNCYVYAQLTETAKKEKTWYDSLDDKAIPLVMTPDEDASDFINSIDAALATNVDRALVWKDGQTYYYFDIIHQKVNGQNPASEYVGVVRNHVYKTKITKIAGLGTPVYDPKEIIYPEKPENNDHYVAAEINILSWRIVSDDYELNW